MKTSYLHEMWRAPDNSRLVSKQFSFRLPVHIAAKIAALGEMYPSKNRTQIVADLLTAALADLEDTLPVEKGGYVASPPRSSKNPNYDELVNLFEVGGVRGRFYELADKHYIQLEKELGNEDAKPLYGNQVLEESDFEDK